MITLIGGTVIASIGFYLGYLRKKKDLALVADDTVLDYPPEYYTAEAENLKLMHKVEELKKQVSNLIGVEKQNHYLKDKLQKIEENNKQIVDKWRAYHKTITTPQNTILLESYKDLKRRFEELKLMSDKIEHLNAEAREDYVMKVKNAMYDTTMMLEDFNAVKISEQGKSCTERI